MASKTSRKTRAIFNEGTQNALVLSTLRRRPLTARMARTQLRVKNLSARISNLRQGGYTINTLVSDNGPTKYILA